MIKKLTLALVVTLTFSAYLFAQENNPVLLLIPKEWRFERFELPLDFAPDIK